MTKVRIKASDEAEVQRRKLEELVDRFQSEPDDVEAHRQWKEIEKLMFGMDFPD